MRPIDADKLAIDAMTIRETTDAFIDLINAAPTVEIESLGEYEPVIRAFWHYYTNDEGRARWRCTNCGKLCRQDPHDKIRCSNCGAHMKKEA